MKQEKVNGSPNVQALGEKIDLLREFSSNGNIPFSHSPPRWSFSLQKLFICEDDNNIWLRVHFNTSPHSEKVDYNDFHWQIELESVETKIWRQFPWKALLGKVPSIRVSLDAWMGALELFHSFVTFLYRWLPKWGWGTIDGLIFPFSVLHVGWCWSQDCFVPTADSWKR